jgi:hypothetical protein
VCWFGSRSRNLQPRHRYASNGCHFLKDKRSQSHPAAGSGSGFCGVHYTVHSVFTTIFPNTKTEHTTHATTPTRALVHTHAHRRARQAWHVLLLLEERSGSRTRRKKGKKYKDSKENVKSNLRIDGLVSTDANL